MKSSHTKKNPEKKSRNSKKSKKSKEFFEDLKSVHLIWKGTTPKFQCLNFFFIHEIFIHEKIQKKSEKSEIPIIPRIFFEII